MLELHVDMFEAKNFVHLCFMQIIFVLFCFLNFSEHQSECCVCKHSTTRGYLYSLTFICLVFSSFPPFSDSEVDIMGITLQESVRMKYLLLELFWPNLFMKTHILKTFISIHMLSK